MAVMGSSARARRRPGAAGGRGRRRQRFGARGEVAGHGVERAATAAISSPPRSGARADRSPPPSRRAALSSARKRRRAGPKIMTEVSTAPTISTPAATIASIGAKRPRRNPNGACGGQRPRHEPPPTRIGDGRRNGRRRVRTAERRATGPIGLSGASRKAAVRTRASGRSARAARPSDPRSICAWAHPDQRIGNDALPARDHAGRLHHDEERVRVLRTDRRM